MSWKHRGQWMYGHTHSPLGTRWNWVVSLMPQLLYPQGMSPWYPTNKRWGSPQSWTGAYDTYLKDSYSCGPWHLIPTFWTIILKFDFISFSNLMTGPTPLPKWFLHIVQSRASSFKWEYPLLSLRSSSSFLRLLPHLLVTSISPSFIFPSITCFRRQFHCEMCFDHSFIQYSVWRQVQSLLQNDASI